MLERYRKIRPQIKTGSCILWQGEGLLSRAISLWSEYTHASLVIRLDKYAMLQDRVFLIESLAEGPVPRLLSKRLEGYKGKAFLFTPDSVTSEKVDCILAQAITICAEGIRYDYSGLFKNMIMRVNRNATKLFCSEEVDWIWTACGVNRNNSKYDNLAPTPGDLPAWYDGELIQIYP